jgi:SAM-dependent methyltransferase
MTERDQEVVESERRGSPDRFGHSWNIYDEILPVHEEQFLRWTTGIEKHDWRGKSFLDVGCGIGRNSYWPMRYGAESCLSIDIDPRTLAAAKKNLSPYAGAVVADRSAYSIDEIEKFDFAFSIGVVHHLDNPGAAVREMKKSLKQGGTLLLWLYGYENNEWLIRYFNPARKFLFSRMPLPVVHALSAPATALLWLYLKVGLGSSQYLRLIRHFSFSHLRAIVYDHMIPVIANYYTRDEAIGLLADAGMENIRAHWVNEMSWTVIATKPVAHRAAGDSGETCAD